jgi:hypothetical protein
MAEFDRTMGQWSRGSNYCHLTEEQYRTLL